MSKLRRENRDGRPRVLLLAETANPEMTSVPLIGWSIAEAVSKRADVLMATHIRNREAIVAQGWAEGREFVTVDTEAWARVMIRIARLLGASDDRGWTIYQALAPIGTYLFEREIWRRFRSELSAGRFDLVHRLIPMSPTTPSYLAGRLRRIGVPLIVGPLNGGLPWPGGFNDRQLREREVLSRVRGAFRLLPGYRSIRRHAGAILAGSQYTLGELPAYARPQTMYLPENGIDVRRFDKRRTRRAAVPLRGAFVGRLVPYKCADLLLRAAADRLRDGGLRLDIVGDGPDRHLLRALVERLGVRDAVTFHGAVPHRKVQDILVECDFLACPSIREFGGGVVLEAMAVGVTPIVADYGGPAELVDDRTGLRVPFGDADSLVDGFRRTIDGVIADPARLDRLGAAAVARVASHFTWDRKAEQLVDVYRWTMEGGVKPEPMRSTGQISDPQTVPIPIPA